MQECQKKNLHSVQVLRLRSDDRNYFVCCLCIYDAKMSDMQGSDVIPVADQVLSRYYGDALFPLSRLPRMLQY